MSGTAPRLAWVAGEASGDVLASLVLRAVRRRWPQAQCYGIGGEAMQREGFDVWWPRERLSVHGLIEALAHLRELTALRRTLLRRLIASKPDLFIGVDAPDFNLGLEQSLRAAGIPVIHMVSPTIWAWRAGRAARIRKSADHVLCIFPFEPDLLAQHQIAATYIGHPLANEIALNPDREAARARLELPAKVPVIALLPGSRLGEVQRLLPTFLGAAALIQQARPEARFVLPMAPGMQGAIRAQLSGMPNLLALEGQSHDALAACDVALVASGTATLETALHKRPMVIAYRLHPLSTFILRRMTYQPWIGQPNILCREFVVPELLQEQVQPDALAALALDWLDAPQRVAALATRFAALHQDLRRDSGALAAEVIAQMLAAR